MNKQSQRIKQKENLRKNQQLQSIEKTKSKSVSNSKKLKSISKIKKNSQKIFNCSSRKKFKSIKNQKVPKKTKTLYNQQPTVKSSKQLNFKENKIYSDQQLVNTSTLLSSKGDKYACFLQKSDLHDRNSLKVKILNYVIENHIVRDWQFDILFQNISNALPGHIILIRNCISDIIQYLDS